MQSKTQLLHDLGIDQTEIHWNLSSEALAELAVKQKHGVFADSGALAVNTGKFTGRSPKDRFIVEDEITKDAVWWGGINLPFQADRFSALKKKVTDYLNTKTLYARQAYVCADESFKTGVTVINEYPWSNLFVYNMFIRPTTEELEHFSSEWTVLNAPGFYADPKVDGTRSENFAVLSFKEKTILIGGTGYTGEIKKGIFSALNFILPFQKNTLSMHCSANVGKDNDTAIFFGLSGTGKTTLSADPNRNLIGDDEHGWSEDSVFNFEGGCYAKTIDLTEQKEPEIYGAIKPGALLENIGFHGDSNKVDFSNSEITENTRVSYPIYHIENIQKPSVGPAPKNIFFLTCDAFGVLPPISKLTKGQAMFHFISGYTAKVAGTEADITEPQTTFSACFGAPFMPLHPTYYAKLLGEKLEANPDVNVWLVNTGWTGGEYGVGSRMKLKYTRAMIQEALSGRLDKEEFSTEKYFGLSIPKACDNVPSEVLNPKNTWEDPAKYEAKVSQLAKSFVSNFAQFEENASEEILEGKPLIERG